MTKEYCLSIEIAGRPDCGYSIAFESPDLASHRPWREEVKKAVFKAGDGVFGPGRDKVVSTLLKELEGINALFPEKVKSLNGVPALQIESVDGRRLEVEFSGTFDPATTASFSRKTLAVSRQINGHGAGGIRAAVKGPFTFIGPVSALAAPVANTAVKKPRPPKP